MSSASAVSPETPSVEEPVATIHVVAGESEDDDAFRVTWCIPFDHLRHFARRPLQFIRAVCTWIVGHDGQLKASADGDHYSDVDFVAPNSQLSLHYKFVATYAGSLAGVVNPADGKVRGGTRSSSRTPASRTPSEVGTRSDIKNRDGNRCVFSLTTFPDQAHIIPLRVHDKGRWDILASTRFRAGLDINGPENRISLNPPLHRLIDQGVYAILPLGSEPQEDGFEPLLSAADVHPQGPLPLRISEIVGRRSQRCDDFVLHYIPRNDLAEMAAPVRAGPANSGTSEAAKQPANPGVGPGPSSPKQISSNSAAPHTHDNASDDILLSDVPVVTTDTVNLTRESEQQTTVTDENADELWWETLVSFPHNLRPHFQIGATSLPLCSILEYRYALSILHRYGTPETMAVITNDESIKGTQQPAQVTGSEDEADSGDHMDNNAKDLNYKPTLPAKDRERLPARVQPARKRPTFDDAFNVMYSLTRRLNVSPLVAARAAQEAEEEQEKRERVEAWREAASATQP